MEKQLADIDSIKAALEEVAANEASAAVASNVDTDVKAETDSKEETTIVDTSAEEISAQRNEIEEVILLW